MDYAQALATLDSFVNYERISAVPYPGGFKLDRMRALAKEFGNPQNAYESVLIAGSKGKGSTAAVSSSILRMENLRVGLYTSPHLADIRERIQVNGLCISQARFTEEVMALERVLDSAAWRRDAPTYFEALTAIAFHYFREMKVHVAVLEVGLGGIYDSTNIAPAKVAGLASVGLEHTDKLGKTLSKIAVQKCGIIKGREVVVSAPQPPEVNAVIERTVEEREAQLYRVRREIQILERDPDENRQRFDIRSPLGNFYNLELGLLGAHQIENAALAVGLTKALEKKTRLKISDNAVRQGVADARWPGRMEIVSRNPLVLLDGAHTPNSAGHLVLGIQRHFHYEKLIVVLGVSDDKDVEGILSGILPEASVVVVTQSESPRALPAKTLARAAANFDKPVWVEEKAEAALEKALSLASNEDLVLVTGSLYVVGEVRRYCADYSFQ